MPALVAAAKEVNDSTQAGIEASTIGDEEPSCELSMNVEDMSFTVGELLTQAPSPGLQASSMPSAETAAAAANAAREEGAR